MIEVPFIDTPSSSFEINTAKGVLTAEIRFNVVLQRWICSAKMGDVSISEGIRVLLNTDLIPRHLGFGQLVCMNLNGTDQPSRENVLNERGQGDRDIYLYYLEESEIASTV